MNDQMSAQIDEYDPTFGQAIPEAKKSLRDMSVACYIFEKYRLHRSAVEDSEALCGRGLTPQEIDVLPALIEGLRLKEAIYQESLAHMRLVYAAGNLDPARELISKILREFYFAYHDNDNMMRTLASIKAKGHLAEVSFNLLRLVDLARKYPEPLQAIRMDMDLIKQADTMVCELDDDFISRRVDAQYDWADARNARNQAYLDLKKAADTVSRFGKFIYPQGNPRRDCYTSTYLRVKRKKTSQELARLKQEAAEHGARQTAQNSAETASPTVDSPQTPMVDGPVVTSEPIAAVPKKIGGGRRKKKRRR